TGNPGDGPTAVTLAPVTTAPVTTGRVTTAPVTPTTVATTPACAGNASAPCGSGHAASSAPVVLIVALVVGCVLCLAVGWALGRRAPRGHEGGRRVPAAVAPAPEDRHRLGELADGVMAARDAATDPALAARLG